MPNICHSCQARPQEDLASIHSTGHHQGILAAMVVFQSAPSYLALQHVIERHDVQHVLGRHDVPHDALCDVT